MWIKELLWKLENMNYSRKVKQYVDKCKRKYPDYVDDEYNDGALKFIWGIKACDDLSGKDVNIHTMNDIDITYDRDTQLYMLGVETAYLFHDQNAGCKYLRELLAAFDVFMEANNYSKTDPYCLFMSDLSLSYKAPSISELYTQFKLFVEGFCVSSGGQNGERKANLLLWHC